MAGPRGTEGHRDTACPRAGWPLQRALHSVLRGQNQPRQTGVNDRQSAFWGPRRAGEASITATHLPGGPHKPLQLPPQAAFSGQHGAIPGPLPRQPGWASAGLARWVQGTPRQGCGGLSSRQSPAICQLPGSLPHPRWPQGWGLGRPRGEEPGAGDRCVGGWVGRWRFQRQADVWSERGRQCHPAVTSGLAWGHRELGPTTVTPIRFLP